MTKQHLRYEQPTPLSRADALRLLETGKPHEIERTLVAIALYEEDFEFALENVLRSARSANDGVRGTSVLCLGHLARIHGQLPEKPVVDVVRAGLVDSSEYVRGQAEIAADDIEMFVPGVGLRIRAS